MAHHFDSGFSTEQMWHGLGNILEKPPETIDEALKAGGMDWKVLEQMNLYIDHLGKMQLNQEAQSLVRSDNGKLLAVKNFTWEIVQNDEAFRFFEPMVESGKLILETGVCLREGRQIALTARLNTIADVVANDPVSAYLVLYNSHDGSSCLGVQYTNTRIVCANTLGVVINEGRNTRFSSGDDMVVSGKVIKLRHTRSIHDNLNMVQNLMDWQNRCFEISLGEYKQMSHIQLTADQVVEIYGKAYQVPTDDLAIVKKQAHYQKIVERFESGIGSDIKGVSGNGWGLYNAITQYNTHDRRSVGENDTEKLRAKFNSLYFGNSATVNDRAHTAILEYA